MTKCVNCSCKVPLGDEICPDCYNEEFGQRERRKKARYCEYCGVELDDDDERLCKDCQDEEDAEND